MSAAGCAEISMNFASKDPQTIDVDALNQIEALDDFAVKLTKKDFLTDFYSDTDAAGNDVLVFTCTNNSGETLTGVTAFVTAYDSDKTAIVFSTGGFAGKDDNPYIVSVSWDELSISPGESENLAIRTDKNSTQDDRVIDDVSCIAVSYSSEGGEVKNPNAEAWEQSAFK